MNICSLTRVKLPYYTTYRIMLAYGSLMSSHTYSLLEACLFMSAEEVHATS